MNTQPIFHLFNKLFLTVVAFTCLLQADPWHPEITHRPRTLYLAEDIDAIRGRLGSEPYHTIWANSLGEYHSIYVNARRAIDVSSNTASAPRASLDKRCWIAKDAAFVYAMNRQADGLTDLQNNIDTGDNPWTRDEYLVHATDYLETLDPAVLGPSGIIDLESYGPMINNWQYRVRELMDYSQAYDILLGAGMETNTTIENNLASFANNLLDKYTATEYTNQYLLQRNNHKLTIGAALGMVAIVLNHHNDASDWINAGMLLIEWVTFGDPEQGIDGYNLVDADGGYAEGTHYMHYSMKKAAPFFVAMKNFNGDWTETYSSSGISGFYPAYGTANNLTLQNPFFDSRFTSIFEWAMKIRLPDGTLPVMEDSPIQIHAPELNLLSPQYDFQFISNDDYPPLVRHLTDLRADYIAAGNNFGGAQTVPLENFTLLPDGGSGIFRNQDLGLYLHINGKNGITRMAAAAHDQADVTHFEIEYQNEKMSLEGGYAGWNYRYDINKPENHNSILVNGFGARPPSGPSFSISYSGFPPTPAIDFNSGEPSPVDGFLENSQQTNHFSYLECRSEYGQAYSRNTSDESMEGQQIWEFDNNDNTNVEFTRCILFVDDEYFIVLDEIDDESNQSNTYSWRFHANAGGDTGGSLEQTPNGGVISQTSGAKLSVYTETPDGSPTMTYPTAQHSNYIQGPSFYQDHTVIQAEQTGVDTDFLTVFFPYMVNAPVISSLSSTANFIALLVDRENAGIFEYRYEIVLAQPGNEAIDIAAETMANGVEIPSIQTSATFVTISLQHGAPIDADHIRVFGKGDEGNETVTINGVSYDLITDPDGPAPVAHVQFINNDILHNALSLGIGPLEETVIDTTVSDLEYMSATSFFEVPTNMSLHLIEDSTGNDLGQFNFAMEDDSHYLIMLNNDTLTGEIVPVMSDGKVVASGPAMIAINAFHGVHDAPPINVTTPELPTPLVDNLDYGEFVGYTEVPAMIYPLDFTFDLYGETISFNGDVDLTPYAGSATVMVASGWLDSDDPDYSWIVFYLVHPDGAIDYLDVSLGIDGETLPGKFALHPNFPNPFNPITHINYDLPEHSDVNLKIYNMIGQEVKTLVNQNQLPGFKSVVWNGTNNLGRPVSAGVYLYQIRAKGFSKTRKMILLK